MNKSMSTGLLLLVAVLMIPVACAGDGGMVRVYPENDTAGYVPVDIIVIDPAIKAATPYFFFLVLDGDGKKTYLENMDADIDILFATDPEKEAKKAGMKAGLNAIWDKYPVVSETGPGSTGTRPTGDQRLPIRFAPSVTSTRLTDDENAAILESAAIMKEVYVKSHPTQQAPLPAVFAIIAAGCIGILTGRRRRGK